MKATEIAQSGIGKSFIVLLFIAGSVSASEMKRADVFEFSAKPVVTRQGDDITIAFGSKAACDATIAIEDKEGMILRHLASGVLGKNAPAPFKKGTLVQSVIWDGKDDQGKYVDDKDSCRVRVSLGLKACFERTLFWSPKKRVQSIKYMQIPPLITAAPEGVYVYDGGNCEHIRFFGHEGGYERTVYPPPADKVKDLIGVPWRKFPQDEQTFPLKGGLPFNTFLTTAKLGDPKSWPSRSSSDPQSMAIHGKNLVLAGQRVNWLSTDGTSGGRELHGPEVWYPVSLGRMHEYPGGTEKLAPESMVISPDGKWLYMTGYHYVRSWHEGGLHGVVRVAMDGAGKPEVFLGDMKQGAKGKGNGQFDLATSVAVDIKGRIYVADHGNNRIQVFDVEKKHLKNIPVERPTYITVNPKNGEIYCFSWRVPFERSEKRWKARYYRLGAFDDPAVKAQSDLDIVWNPLVDGNACRAAVDFWTDPPTIWLAEAPCEASYRDSDPRKASIRLYVEKGKKLKLKEDFFKTTEKAMGYPRPTRHMKQRLYFDHKNETLFVGELHEPANIHATSISDLAKIDPTTGKTKQVNLPFDCEDLAFDMNGMAYLRTENVVARFDARVWREVPFDYGEELKAVTTYGFRKRDVASAVVFSGGFESSSQLGGMSVSPKGNLVVTTFNPNKKEERNDVKGVHVASVKAYTPPIYPGRARPWEVHVWNTHGTMTYEDAVPGAGRPVGVHMDKDDFIYIIMAGVGAVSGSPYFNPISCTAFKMKPKAKVLATEAVIPLTAETRPKRKPDATGTDFAGDIWVEDAEWVRGGVAIDGKRFKCHCPSQSRPALDYFARYFLTEPDRYSVLVVDSNNNEIMRVGRYGNVDDGVPLEKEGGPENPRSIGGDEVALMHPQMLATHSDRRLFIGDLGNARIVSVKLDYNQSVGIPLKGIVDKGK